jgi:hypothetical protein
MSSVLALVVPALMLGVLVVLGLGVVGLARGGDPARSNRLMQWRIVLQAAAIVLFIALLTFARS